MKKCGKCNKELPPSIFSSILASPICQECETEDNKLNSYQPRANMDKVNRMNHKKIVDQLNSCLATTQNEAAFSATKLKNSSKCDTYTNPNLEAQCLQGEINIQNQIIARLNQEKNDCYKRYK